MVSSSMLDVLIVVFAIELIVCTGSGIGRMGESKIGMMFYSLKSPVFALNLLMVEPGHGDIDVGGLMMHMSWKEIDGVELYMAYILNQCFWMGPHMNKHNVTYTKC